MLKKMIIASALISLAASAAAHAEGISVLLDGKNIEFDVAPRIIDERTMVPLRAIFEALGAEVEWNGENQTVTSQMNGTTVVLTVDSPIMYVNGAAVELDRSACIIDERTLVPVRAVSEAYGIAVDWDGQTQTVYLRHTDTAPDTANVSEFGRLSAEIMKKGEYDEDYQTYVLESSDVRENGSGGEAYKLYISVDYSPSTNSLYFYSFRSGADFYSFVDIYIADDGSGVSTCGISEAGSESFITYYFKDGKYGVYESTMPDEKAKIAPDMINEALSLFDYMLQSKGIGISLEKMLGASRAFSLA